MDKSDNNTLISDEVIIKKTNLFRGSKVMMDRDLAELYGIETKQLKRAVRRNISRFSNDFMFELSPEGFNNLRSQFGTSSWVGPRFVPMAFTEHDDQILVIFEYLKKLEQAKHQMREHLSRVCNRFSNYLQRTECSLGFLCQENKVNSSGDKVYLQVFCFYQS